MRFIAVSILSFLACIPAFADVRLPVVNVGAGAISARAAFGEPVAVTGESSDNSSSEKVAKNVVARSSSANLNAKLLTLNSAKNSGDILSPRRPSSDLWAKNEKPLRLPEANEFTVIRSDAALPEESLGPTFAAAPTIRAAVPVAAEPIVAARAALPSPAADAAPAARDPELDFQIAKLVDLQRKADDSIRIASIPKPGMISSFDAKPSLAQRADALSPLPDVSVRRDFAAPSNLRDEVSISRVVVPMEPDVVVRPVKNSDAAPQIARANPDDDQNFSKMSPSELKKAFKKTYLSENKHLSAFQVDDRFDVASSDDASSSMEGFTAERDLSEAGGVRPLEIRLGFRGNDAALSRDNFNLLSEYAGIVVGNPKRAIQISIPERFTRSLEDRRLAARRLAIVEQVLRDIGVSDYRIMPVLSQREDESFVLRVISSDQFETLTQQRRDMFGDTVSKKTYKSMSW